MTAQEMLRMSDELAQIAGRLHQIRDEDTEDPEVDRTIREWLHLIACNAGTLAKYVREQGIEKS